MADLADMIQKAAFYRAGGTDPGTSFGEQFSQGADIVNKTIANVLALKKAGLENTKTQAETTHLGAETSKLNETPSSAYMKPATTAGSTAIAGTPGVSGTAGTDGGVVTTPQPAGAPTWDYGKMSLEDRDKLSQAQLREAQAGQLTGGKKLYANPDDWTDVSPTADATHTYPVPEKLGIAGATKANLQQNSLDMQQKRIDDMSQHFKDTLDLLNQKLDFERQKQQDLVGQKNKALIERASTSYNKEMNAHGVKAFLGMMPPYQSYLDAAASQEQPDAPAQGQPPAVGGTFNGEKVISVKRLR